MVSVAGIPPPPPPEVTLKMIYEPMRPSFYLSLWDAILLLDDVSAAGWASGIVIKKIGPGPFQVGFQDEQSHEQRECSGAGAGTGKEQKTLNLLPPSLASRVGLGHE